MKAYNRVNRGGQAYTLVELPSGGTQIRLRMPEKAIVVPYEIEMLNQAWYDWTMDGKSVQVAFHFMTADEREFIMTGITSEEWRELFGEKEEEI